METKNKNLIPEVVDKATQNLIDPSTKELGNTLGDLFHLIFGKISFERSKQDVKEQYFLDKLRIQYEEDLNEFKKSIEKRVNQIPEDQRIEVSLSVTGNILNKARYNISEKMLREMFAKLVAGSLDKNFVDVIHPSFATIINSLSIIDAKNFSLFAYGKALPIVEYYLLQGNNQTREFGVTPIFISLFSEDSYVQSMSINSLERLGLVKTSFEKELPDKDHSIYNKFMELDYFKQIHESYGDDIKIRRGYVECTTFGMQFGRACIWGPAHTRDMRCYWPGNIV